MYQQVTQAGFYRTEHCELSLTCQISRNISSKNVFFILGNDIFFRSTTPPCGRGRDGLVRRAER